MTLKLKYKDRDKEIVSEVYLKFSNKDSQTSVLH